MTHPINRGQSASELLIPHFKIATFGMWRRAVLYVGTDVREEPAASIVSVHIHLPILKMEVKGSSEMLLFTYQTTQWGIPQDGILNTNRHENLKRHIIPYYGYQLGCSANFWDGTDTSTHTILCADWCWKNIPSVFVNLRPFFMSSQTTKQGQHKLCI
jgi:hypothetical protein